MNKKSKHSAASAPATKRKAPQQTAATSAASRKFWLSFKPSTARCLTYLLGFLALWILLGPGYGDVLTRAEQESYVSPSADSMYYVLSSPMGTLFYASRYALLIFKNALIGGCLLALIYTLTARFTDYALHLPRRFEGMGFLVPLAQFGWIVWEGTNLYFKHEPSRFMLLALALLLISAVAAGIAALVRRKSASSVPERVRPVGLLATLLLSGALLGVARTYNANEWLTARLQNLQDQQDWEAMIEAARSAKRPTRAVVAYHAIALEQTDQLLEGMFDIVYDFPPIRLDNPNEEYGLFVSDCNFHAGLLNASYRSAMDAVVMNGPKLWAFKRMAVCALLNGEDALCRRYLSLIKNSYFEGEFVEKIEGMLKNKKRIDDDACLAHVRSLYPHEDLFEQEYRSPAFLGYNVGLGRGSDATLITSTAACLYSKDLQNFLLRAQILAQKGKSFPECMQQAIAIMALKQPDILKSFPQVQPYVSGVVHSFLMDAKPYVKDKEALRRELKDAWLGTYLYYYYTENNNPDQIDHSSNQEKAGVN